MRSYANKGSVEALNLFYNSTTSQNILRMGLCGPEACSKKIRERFCHTSTRDSRSWISLQKCLMNSVVSSASIEGSRSMIFQWMCSFSSMLGGAMTQSFSDLLRGCISSMHHQCWSDLRHCTIIEQVWYAKKSWFGSTDRLFALGFIYSGQPL